ncbi:uncharacterized protein LOC127502926 isoform X2 [Ctenopharyngodon idella]|uniref:uncharacterized protein LOC127502926 isoform X2 n=1 Tax=Ctenopharyngodon idella TaxID=7959 RepID=UPI0022322826|nr:uncharacterized protein LOC127502926 isoform X2 [Ctenopharyngodon idella]
MDLEDIYQNVELRDIKDTFGPQTQNKSKDEGKDEKRRGSRCLVLTTACLGLICVLLLVFIILQHSTITAERDLLKSYKNTAEEFNQTINSLQDNYTDLMFEKDQLQNNFTSLSQKKLELELELRKLNEQGSSGLESSIKIGDKVRVKPSVVTPTHKWGAVTHKSIGVVKKVQGDSLTIDFPEHKNWNGIISEMELVTDTCTVDIQVGDRVRVKPSITTPKHKWGSATHKSVGVVKEVQGESLTIDFPEQKNWKGIISEMELVTGTCTVDIQVGDRVRVKPSITSPKHGWGSATHKSVGVVKDINVIVDFPEHKGWTGIFSEMELTDDSG